MINQLRVATAFSANIEFVYTPVGDQTIIGSDFWIGEDGKRPERYQVLTVREGKIVDIQGCRSRPDADRFAGRKHLLSA